MPAGQVVALTVDDGRKRADRIGDADVDTGVAGELLGDMEGLGKELLQLTSTVDRKALLLGQLVHTENGDDVLQVEYLEGAP